MLHIAYIPHPNQVYAYVILYDIQYQCVKFKILKSVCAKNFELELIKNTTHEGKEEHVLSWNTRDKKIDIKRACAALYITYLGIFVL